jgi:uncharacterized membrane protein
MAQDAAETVKDTAEEGREKIGGGGNGDLAKKVLLPAAAGLGTFAATYAARKAPELLGNIKPKLEEKGTDEASKVGKQALQKAGGEGGVGGKLASAAAKKLGGGSGGGGKTRRLPIQRWTDVAVPIDVAYEKWTDFESFPKFMHRVLDVEKKGRDKVSWREKIWFSTREWEGQITDRRKNERIAWKTTKGTSHTGIVTFHKLDTNLTRVMVDIDFRPTGMFEKMASGLRFVKRAVQADLARFKAYAEMGEARGLDYGHDVDKEDGDDRSRSDKQEERSGDSGGDDSTRSREPAAASQQGGEK